MKHCVRFFCQILLCLSLFNPSIGLADNYQKIQKARDAIDLERLDQSLSLLKSIEPVDNQEAAQIDQLIGEIYLQVGKPSKALEFFEQAITSIMEDGEAMAGLAEASFGVGKITQAKRYAQSALRDNDDLVRAHIVLAKIEASTGNTHRAKQRLEKLFQQKARNEDVAIAYADFLYDQGDDKKALNLLSDFTRKNINGAKALDHFGRLLWLAGYERKAVKAREHAGKLYDKQGNHYRAENILNWVLEHKNKARRKAQPFQDNKQNSNFSLARHFEPIQIPFGYRPAGQGSGFIVDEGRYVVTNHHVVEGAERLVVRNGTGEVRNATVIRFSHKNKNDLAVLKLDKPYDANYAIHLENMGDPTPGRTSIVMGYPLAFMLGKHMPSVTEGSVSAVIGAFNQQSKFQTTAKVNKGNSGGPIFDLQGNLIGVVVMKWFAIPTGNKNEKQIERIEDVNEGIKISRVFELMGWNGGEPIDVSDQETMSVEELYQEMLPKVVYVQRLARR